MPRDVNPENSEDYMVMGDVIFGCDKRDAWKRSEDMRSEIEKMFSEHYGPNYDNPSNPVDGEKVDWEKLGNQLRRKCKLY